uniref:DUF1758 domain-containing protein n=1 Tax=Angiostrongylus cantonensis TaxID=6313 RepID=A0A0K0DMM2_ANGCA
MLGKKDSRKYNNMRTAEGYKGLPGQAEVFNPDKAGQELTEVILDTGSHRSFIISALANRIQLRDSDSIELTIHTFGDPKPITKKCGITTLKLRDAFRAEHNITVARIDKITQSLERLNLDREDAEFFECHKIKLSINPDLNSIHPQILLGCSDSLTMLDSGLTQAKTLPSGLKLIPSKLGYLVTETLHSRIDTSNETASLMTDGAQVGQHITEQQSWEKYWSFESSGIQEYTGPNVKERQQQNDYI